MTSLKTKIGSAIAIAAFVGGIVAPVAAFADTTVTINHNGEDSTNKVTVENENTTTVTQSNSTFVVNSVTTDANTGGNKVSGNTGGNTDITTGNITTNVVINNGGSTNTATVNPCGCPQGGDTTITVKHNGLNSNNTVSVENENTTKVTQKNWTTFINGVSTDANTGYNKSKSNTGGTNTITTGNIKTKVIITNTGSTNTL